MSSTLRSNVRHEHIADYYRTPINKILEFLEELESTISLDKGVSILDPCGGGDRTNPMSYPTALREKGFYNVDTIDIREDSLAKVKGDYLLLDCKDKYDVIITNYGSS